MKKASVSGIVGIAFNFGRAIQSFSSEYVQS